MRLIFLFLKHSYELQTSHMDVSKKGTNTTLSMPVVTKSDVKLTHSSFILHAISAL